MVTWGLKKLASPAFDQIYYNITVYFITESLQVGNYGIGGHYLPHFDSDVSKFPHLNLGDRIATVLFYVSELRLFVTK